MSETVTNELLYSVLKKIQEDVSYIRRRADDHDEQFKGMRHMLASMQSDDLRHEATIAGLRSDVDRIKNRLELADA
ncbi:MAG: hypothetical protein DM484_07475 [Candidatus Methylumidiphilus alinenensis]|uniref:Uncharacterized protein n=1 Tax=Candidatus Methylumidiphilus alinenensis TaxID=2202197 RepID=A0A2W4TB60_9GAMM|nr:MAG: hypothetical protein DM484_07475 [Candidatus Methylumidiphilus alinenensis]